MAAVAGYTFHLHIGYFSTTDYQVIPFINIYVTVSLGLPQQYSLPEKVEGHFLWSWKVAGQGDLHKLWVH